MSIGNNPKRAIGGPGSDTTAIHNDVNAEINAIDEKVDPIGNDLILIEDDADSNSKKKVQLSNIINLSNVDIEFYEEYIGLNLSEVWNQNGLGAAFTLFAEKNGSMRCQTAAVSGRNSFLDWGYSSGNGVLEIVPRCEMKHRRLHEETSNLIGRVCALYNDDNNVIQFNFTSAISANWRAQVRVGGVDTFVDTTIAADTSYHIFEIITDDTNCTFYIDGIQRAQIATPVALKSLLYQPRIGQVETTDGVSKGTRTDYVKLITYNAY